MGYGSNEDGAPAISVYADDTPDLSILRRAPVRHLEIMGNMPLLASGKVMKLGPLAGLPLESLTIWKAPVNDLSALEFTQLKKLLIMGAGVTDISPLKNLPLTDLQLSCTWPQRNNKECACVVAVEV